MVTSIKGICVMWLCLMTYVDITDAQETNPVSGDLHSSPEHLESVFAFDKVVGDALKYLPFPSEPARRYLESYGWLVVDAIEYEGNVGHPAFIGHPLHVFALIKRLVLFYPDIRNIFQSFEPLEEGSICMNNHTKCDIWSSQGRCSKDPEFMTSNCPKSCGICTSLESIKVVKKAENETVLPSSWDLTGASEALGNIQQVYDLPIHELTKGRIYNSFCSVELNEWDCVRIARASARQERLSSAWLWYHHVRTTTTNPEMAAYANDIINNIADMHDRTWKDSEAYFPKRLSEVPIQRPSPSTFFQLCRGEELRNEDLTCEMSSRGNPYFLLQPVKQETILKDPEMYIFYDVLSETEMEDLKQLSQGKLVRDPGEQRVSRMALLEADDSHPVLESLNRRSSILTGLLVDEGTQSSIAAEPLKIRNYGTGGHLVPHADVYIKHKENSTYHPKTVTDGDRMATIMYYLSDVTAGGRTAFFRTNVTISPVKGSAVFWYNLKKNGDYDRRMSHAGCPVVLGNKWLALKWIRENYNFQTRPCATVQDE